MNELDQKINGHFSGLVVRKDLVKVVKGNAIVPTYVLEYLLGHHCATSDESAIRTGIETVKEILRKHYVHRNKAGLVKSIIKEIGHYNVIDKISVSLNDKENVYEAEFTNLGIRKVLINSGTVNTHSKLLVSNVWCLADIEYKFPEDKKVCPWILSSLKPIQVSHFDFEGYVEARKKFTTDEWIDLLIQSVGFNPKMFSRRSKLLQLVRLIPYCERNYNLIELGSKGTGKSHIYSEFSPNGILISGGEVSVPKLFINNSNGKIGLVGYLDVVAFDEFSGKGKQVDNVLVDIMKNYMANKSFSRGVESFGADASMVFVGNTKHSVSYMLEQSNLFEELPEKFYDSAFLDRLHFYIPGWEVDIIRDEMFSNGYGFVVDYLAEILHSMRGYDYSDRYKLHFSLSSDVSTRDLDSINKTFSGLMKILFPHDGASKEEIEDILKFSIEGRKRVKDHLMRIDSTYPDVRFTYRDKLGQVNAVSTFEEEEFYHDYLKKIVNGISLQEDPNILPSKQPLTERYIIIQNSQRNVSFDALFGVYLRGASSITITDSSISRIYQVQNFIEFLEAVMKQKTREEKVAVHLITTKDEFKGALQQIHFEKIKDSFRAVGIDFTWEFDSTGTIHAGHIVTDHGWKIFLSLGLDIFKHREKYDTFYSLQQWNRRCREAEVIYTNFRQSVASQKIVD